MKVPNSFNDFTVKQFIDFKAVAARKDLDLLDREVLLLSAATGSTVEEVESLPRHELMDCIKTLNLLQFTEPSTKFKRIIRVNGKFYRAISDAKYLSEELSTNQYVTFKELTKVDPIQNMNKILPLLYTPYKFFGKPNISAKQEYLSEQFLNARMGDIYGAVFFYEVLYKELMETMQPYFDKASQEIAEHMREIEEFGKGLGKGMAGMSH